MTGPMPYREEGAPAPFTFKDPSAPTLEEATLALDAANDYRAKWLTERKIALGRDLRSGAWDPIEEDRQRSEFAYPADSTPSAIELMSREA